MVYLSEDKNMIDVFFSGYDIYVVIVVKIYKVDIKEVIVDMCCKVKIVNFGIIYGIFVFGLVECMNVDCKEVKELIDGYFEIYL